MRKDSKQDLIAQVLSGSERALARCLSQIENNETQAREIIKTLFTRTGKAKILGITGVPGAGKSTLVSQLILALTAQEKKVAVLAVDPSSPFTGGAILGDRIRMLSSIASTGVFVRSVASRGALGGLSPSIHESIMVLDAAGFDVIIVETVGVGQAEVDIVKVADLAVVVLVPGMGDSVQALKAGILEIADIFVINKADHQGTERLRKDLISVIQLNPNSSAPKPEILQTVATEAKGITEFVKAIDNFFGVAESDLRLEGRRKLALRDMLVKIVSRELVDERIKRAEQTGALNKILTELTNREIDPYSACDSLKQL
ncbi:methylmalonyl Co-A mutase-associated GTPase MeaB [bacterium]|nr:methylmalonyl Co-A mutase-associated GTPase MeaB [bacterium]